MRCWSVEDQFTALFEHVPVIGDHIQERGCRTKEVVALSSTGVGITGNVTHRAPEASGNNWFPTDKAEPTWIMSGNKIVPLGTTASQATSLAAAAPLAAEAKVAAAPTAVSASADVFRFDAKGAADAAERDRG